MLCRIDYSKDDKEDCIRNRIAKLNVTPIKEIMEN